THAVSIGTCAATTPVTISVIDSNSDPVTTFTGTVTITNGLNLGNYTLNTGTPAGFTNLGSGSATYQFDPADNGQVILNFTAPSIGTYVFDATAGSLDTENYAGGLSVS